MDDDDDQSVILFEHCFTNLHICGVTQKRSNFRERLIAKSETDNKGNTKGKQEKYLENP